MQSSPIISWQLLRRYFLAGIIGSNDSRCDYNANGRRARWRYRRVAGLLPMPVALLGLSPFSTLRSSPAIVSFSLSFALLSRFRGENVIARGSDTF